MAIKTKGKIQTDPKTPIKGTVRTRFAPSPTGYLHIGSARTALFNYLFAKKNKGVFVLRIEDTDAERSKSEFEKDIIESLLWLGLKWDEGPVIDQILKIKNQIGESKVKNEQVPRKREQKYIGNYGPYRQSERKEIYKKYLEKLLKEGKAYYCFCSPEELEAKRQERMSRGVPYTYNGKCSKLSGAEVKRNLKEGKNFVIRLKIPSKKVIINDLIRGRVEFDTGLIGDIVIAKDLENPLYNFSVVIDDFEMKITHIIRGEDLLSNTPKQVILQEYLGFPRPKYAHLPLILGPDRNKLSKRHGAVSVTEYRKEGYLKEAIINMLAFLGWNPGDDREIYSLQVLIKDFSLEKVQKSGAIFNIKKLDYLNGFYIRQKPIDKLTEMCVPFLIKAGLITPIFEEQERLADFTGYFGREIVQKNFFTESGEKIGWEYLKKVISLYQERLKKLSEVSDLVDFFFVQELNYNKDLLKWKEMQDREVAIVLEKLIKILSSIEDKDWSFKKLQEILLPAAESISEELKKEKRDRGYLLWPLRVALTGKQSSAGPFEIAEILGKNKVLKRLKRAKEIIEK